MYPFISEGEREREQRGAKGEEERTEGAEGEEERESPADSLLSREPGARHGA